jgi:hypothetical protein
LLKRPITYKNPFDESKEVTEEHYFHISKTDLVEMEIEEHGATYTAREDSELTGIKAGEELTGMRAKLQRIQDSQDGKAILHEMKDIIRRAYGKRGDGDRFLKTEEIQRDFLATEAFSQLLFELCTNPDEMVAFFAGVFPSNLDQIAVEVTEQAARVSAGREAQAAAKSAGGHPSDPAATPVETALDRPAENEQPSLADRIDAATAENPITLTQAEVLELDSDTLKSGIATGRIKLS